MKNYNRTLTEQSSVLDKEFSNNLDSQLRDKNIPIMIRIISGLIEYYISISDDEKVAILNSKLEEIISAFGGKQYRYELDIDPMADDYMCTEEYISISLENGDPIIND